MTRDSLQLGAGAVDVVEHSVVRLGQTRQIALGITGGAKGADEADFRDGVGFGDFPAAHPLSPSATAPQVNPLVRSFRIPCRPLPKQSVSRENEALVRCGR